MMIAKKSQVHRMVTLVISVCILSSNAFAFLAWRSYQPTEMIDQAEIICTAEVLSTQSQWKEDHRGRHIYTHAKLLVWQKIKGNFLSDYIDLEVVGGTVGDITEIVSDTPVFIKGEQVLLFLRGEPLQVVGDIMGKMSVLNDHVLWGGRWISIQVLSNSLRLGITGIFSKLDEQELPNETYAKPTITSVGPDIGSAGTGTEVTINGTAFGENRDSGTVEFFYTDEQHIPAKILSWSDTQITCEVPPEIPNYPPFVWPSCPGSSPVTVTTLQGTSNEYSFRVTFGYNGLNWSGENPVVSYYINENTLDCNDEGVAVQAAAETWNSTGASFQFQYAGSHTSITASQNEVNEVMWGDIDPMIAARTHTWIQASFITGQTPPLFECDIVFNDDLVWGTDPCIPDFNDVETIALHEFGHWLHLKDLYGNIGDLEYDVAKAMYGFSNFRIKRDLHPDDVAGIHWIYPPASPPIAPETIEYSLSDDDGIYTVRWAACSQASSYQLERSVDGVEWVRVYYGPHTYWDENVDNGQYLYRVAASNQAGLSTWLIADWSCLVKLLWEGSGEPNDPILISTAEQLDRIGSHSKWWSKHVKLMADIDLSEYDSKEGRPAFHLIAPFQDYPPGYWTGVFDGNGHTISNFTYTSRVEGYEGLFCWVGGDPNAEIKRLTLVDPRIEIEGQRGVGSVVGYLRKGTISECYVNGGTVSAGDFVGGLVGINSGGTIINCHANATVFGTSSVGGLVGSNSGYVSRSSSTGVISGEGRVGGLAGTNGGALTQCYSSGAVNGSGTVGGLVGDNSADVIECYSTAIVSATGDSVGGLAGYNTGAVNHCYSTGTVTGSDYSDHLGGLVGSNWWGRVTQCYSTSTASGGGDVGGLVGLNQSGVVTQCYSTGAIIATGQFGSVGGLVGSSGWGGSEGSVTACFWDIQSSGQTKSAGGTGKTTAEMQTASTFLDAGWDFVNETANGTEDIWWIDEGQDYPRLWWEAE